MREANSTFVNRLRPPFSFLRRWNPSSQLQLRRAYSALHEEEMVSDPWPMNLLFATLSEAAANEITRNRDAQGFPENKKAARAGGEVAGKARKDLEQKSGRKVVTSENYLALKQGEKKKQPLTAAATKTSLTRRSVKRAKKK